MLGRVGLKEGFGVVGHEYHEALLFIGFLFDSALLFLFWLSLFVREKKKQTGLSTVGELETSGFLESILSLNL